MNEQIIIIKLTNNEIIGINSSEIDGFIGLTNNNLNISKNNLNFGYIPLRNNIYQIINLDLFLNYKKIDKKNFKTLIILKERKIAFLTNKIENIQNIIDEEKFFYKNKNDLNNINFFIKYKEKNIPIYSLKNIIKGKEKNE